MCKVSPDNGTKSNIPDLIFNSESKNLTIVEIIFILCGRETNLVKKLSK